MSSLRFEPLPVHNGSPLLFLQAQLKSNTAILSFFAFLSCCHLFSQHGTRGWSEVCGVSFFRSQQAIVILQKTSDMCWPQSGDCSAQQHSWHDHNRGYSEPWRVKDCVLFCNPLRRGRNINLQGKSVNSICFFVPSSFVLSSVFNETKKANCLLWIVEYLWIFDEYVCHGYVMNMWWICDEYTHTYIYIWICHVVKMWWIWLYFGSRNDLSFGLALCGIGTKSLPVQTSDGKLTQANGLIEHHVTPGAAGVSANSQCRSVQI